MNTDDYKKYSELQSRTWKLENILRDVFDVVDKAIIVLRVILYVGSVAAAWFYLKDKVLAVGLGSSLSVAHVLIAVREYIARKRKEMVG